MGIRVVTLLAELIDLELWGTNIGNAYLESYTKEKGGIQGRSGIWRHRRASTGYRQGTIYGLRTSGA